MRYEQRLSASSPWETAEHPRWGSAGLGNNRHSVWTTHRFGWVKIPTGCSGRFHMVARGLSPTDQEAHRCMTAVLTVFFARFGLPKQLHSDQGRNFEWSLVKELCEIAGVNKTRTTPFHPRSDGLTERANRTILQMLLATTSRNPQEWPSKIPSILSAYSMTEHSTTHVSPNRAMLGREVLLPASLIAAPPEEIKPSVPTMRSSKIT